MIIFELKDMSVDTVDDSECVRGDLPQQFVVCGIKFGDFLRRQRRPDPATRSNTAAPSLSREFNWSS